MILIAYRHGLRVSELVALRWDQADFAQGRLHANRAKNGLASAHPLGSEEIRALGPGQARSRRELSDSVYVLNAAAIADTSGFMK